MKARRRAPRLPGVALAAGIAGLAACLLVPAEGRTALLASYLSAFTFWSGLSIGALPLIMVHELTGGAWGGAIRRPLDAATRALPLVALFFVPLLLGLSHLYAWARPELVAGSELLQHKRWYLDTPFFVARTVVYFAVWIGLALGLRRDDAPRARRSAAAWSAGGLILYTLTTTFAAVDWLMALTPAWYSTIFGLLVGVGHALSALAFAIVAAIVLAVNAERVPSDVLRDLGNLLLMLVLLWSYLAFMEYLTIWVGNQPASISWYVPRVLTTWRGLGVVVMLFHFAVPFVLLLSREAKRSPAVLCSIAAVVLVAHAADAMWRVIPSIETAGWRWRWTDVAAFIGIGGVWLAAVGSMLTRGARPSAPASNSEVAYHG